MIYVEDHVADGDEEEQISQVCLSRAVGARLDAQQESNDRDLAEANGVDADDLANPAVEVRFRKLGAP